MKYNYALRNFEGLYNKKNDLVHLLYVANMSLAVVNWHGNAVQ